MPMFADDATVASSCMNLKSWLCKLSSCGPTLGYYPNASKTYLVVKEEHEETFCRYWHEHYHHGKATSQSNHWLLQKNTSAIRLIMWTDEIERLAGVATSQPEAAYLFGFHPWPHRSLDVCSKNNPWHPPSSDATRFGNPPNFHSCINRQTPLLKTWMWIACETRWAPFITSAHSRSASRRITAPLTTMIVTQEINQTTDCQLSLSLRNSTRRDN